MKICSMCQKENKSAYKDFCRNCYRRNKVGFTRIKAFCTECSKPCIKTWDRVKGMCQSCHNKERRKIDPAYHERHKKYCRDYQRRKRGIDTELPLLNAPAGSGSIKNGQGYRTICKKEFIGMPHADKKGRIAEHTYIMMNHLGRPLRKGETVHHKNGIRHDNRIENLELWSKSHPPGQRIEDKLKWCYEFIELYKDHKG